MMVNEIHVTDRIPAYVLGALDVQERQETARHLSACPECQGELKSYQELAGMLSLAVPQVEPPLRLRRAILGRAVPAPKLEPRSSLGAWIGQILGSVRPVWVYVSLVLIILLAAGNVVLFNQLQQARSNTGTFHTVRLESPDPAAVASALIIINNAGKTGILVADDLAVLPQEQVYQLWLIKNGQRTSGGIFRVSQDGYGYMGVRSAMPLNSYDAFGVTIEPAGGSPGPTGPKVLGGNS